MPESQVALVTKLRMVSTQMNQEQFAHVASRTELIPVLVEIVRLAVSQGPVDVLTKTPWATYLRLEAMWTLANVATADSDVIKLLLDESYSLLATINDCVLASADQDLGMFDQSVWLLANVSADSVQVRNFVLQ